MKQVLLLGLDSNGAQAIAKFASTYSGTQPLEFLVEYMLGVGKTSSGSLKLLELSSTGELVS
jgi:hypothetical protein